MLSGHILSVHQSKKVIFVAFNNTAHLQCKTVIYKPWEGHFLHFALCLSLQDRQMVLQDFF